MIDHHPKISICIPAYNCSQYLRQTLDSVFCQTLQDFEIIVYDDASTDVTPQIVAAVQGGRVRYFRNQRNLGVAATRNNCLAVARGKYIAWLDADDVYYPEMLAVQSAVLDQHPKVGLAHGAYHVIDHEGKRLPDWPLPFSSDIVESGREAFRELILSNYVTTPTVMVRRECQDRVGPFSETIGKSSTDWEMWLRLALDTDLAFTSTVVAQYRQHDRSISATTRNGKRLRCDRRVIEHVLVMARNIMPDIETLQRQARAALAVKALRDSNEAFTRGCRTAALQAVMNGFRMSNGL